MIGLYPGGTAVSSISNSCSIQLVSRRLTYSLLRTTRVSTYAPRFLGAHRGICPLAEEPVHVLRESLDAVLSSMTDFLSRKIFNWFLQTRVGTRSLLIARCSPKHTDHDHHVSYAMCY